MVFISCVSYATIALFGVRRVPGPSRAYRSNISDADMRVYANPKAISNGPTSDPKSATTNTSAVDDSHARRTRAHLDTMSGRAIRSWCCCSV